MGLTLLNSYNIIDNIDKKTPLPTQYLLLHLTSKSIMYELPDFIPYGYRLLEVLSNNSLGGRITYKAVQLSSDDYVIIKQFNFASSKNWDVYKQIEREINVLQSLDNIGIPKYLETINHPDGLCFVQQYINAPNLSTSISFDTEQIKSITTQLLEILVYLQSRVPSIIHRDIKPENVLYDAKNDRVYLVDFGLAKIGNNDSALSSIVAGTPPFIPPEQTSGKELSNASDLYSLGATIICLVTGIQSKDLNTIVDEDFNINFQSRVSQYNLKFVKWLERMVKRKMNERFPDAKQALKVLNGIDDLIRSPEVNIDQSELVFQAQECGQILTQTLTIQNTVPDTLLRGKWSVYPHHNDPPHTPDDHAFISFSPKEFEGNNIRCKVTVDSRKLKSSQRGERTIILTSNEGIEYSSIPVEIETASAPIPQPKKPGWYWLFLGTLLIGSVFLVQFLWPIEWGIIKTILESILQSSMIRTILGKIGEINLWLREAGIQYWIMIAMIGLIVLGSIISVIQSYDDTFNRRHYSTYYVSNYRWDPLLVGGIGGMWGGKIGGILGGAIGGFIEIMEFGIESIIDLLMAFFLALCCAFLGAFCFAIIGVIIGTIVGIIVQEILVIILAIPRVLLIFLSPILVPINKMSRLGFKRNITSIHLLLTCIAGASIGWLRLVGINDYAILCLAVSSVPLASMLIYPQIKYRKLIARYRKKEQYLIEP